MRSATISEHQLVDQVERAETRGNLLLHDLLCMAALGQRYAKPLRLVSQKIAITLDPAVFDELHVVVYDKTVDCCNQLEIPQIR
ncbi:hypothetical protein D3C81_1543240 [compost metagenome]